MIVTAGACQGDNLFSGESASGRPRVIDIVLPQSVVAGDTVLIRVDATAPRFVDQVLLSLRGAVNRDTVAEIDDDKQQASVIFKIAIPSAIQDSLLRVTAQVSDKAGEFSAPAQVNALAFGPPVVTGVSGPSGVRPGETINIRVTAFGARRVARIDLSARVPVEVVAVGDCLIDARLDALLGATREATVNAAKHSGAERIDVYVEVTEQSVEIFVRDTGKGFDPQAVADDRRGVRHSIVGRMERAGGSAVITSAPGDGTEVELRLERPGSQ
jgi:hypothetical protein